MYAAESVRAEIHYCVVQVRQCTFNLQEVENESQLSPLRTSDMSA